MMNPTSRPLRQLDRAARQVAASEVSGVPARKAENERGADAAKPKAGLPFGQDVLAFQRRDANQDGFLSTKEYGKGQKRQDEFRRYDYDVDGQLSELELAVGRASDEIKRLEDELRGKAPAPTEPAEPTEPKEPTAPVDQPEPEPAAPEAFGYTLKNSHPVSSLATQFEVSPDDLMAANGWTNSNQQIPAGTTINVPDTPASREKAVEYGGRVSDAVPIQEPGAPRTDGTIGMAGDPNDFFMTQFYDPKWNPQGPMASANCGPASLAMALKGLGLQPPGAPDPSNVEGWIDAARMVMTGNTDDSAYTNASQVIAGAQASGATAEPIGFEGIDAALAEGKAVVAAGNPVAYNTDWQDRGLANSEYNGGHFITVTGKDADGNYLINDPLSNVGSVAITPAQLKGYMDYQGWNSAVAIGNPNAPAPKAPTEPTPDAPVDRPNEKPSVIDMPSPNFNERPAGNTIDSIVLHHTGNGVSDGGSAEDIGRFFQNPANQVSAHYTIGKDGTIVQSVPDDKRAWHAGYSDLNGRDNVNDFALGIELVNAGNGHDAYTDAQYEALANLLAYQVETYGVPLDRIVGHRDVSHEGKVDPSDNFDWDRVRQDVEARLA